MAEQTIEPAVLADTLRAFAADSDLLWTVARRAIEDALIEFRDSRISFPFRNNGLVVKEVDGTPSSIIRLGPEDGVRIALLAIADHLAPPAGEATS